MLGRAEVASSFVSYEESIAPSIIFTSYAVHKSVSVSWSLYSIDRIFAHPELRSQVDRRMCAAHLILFDFKVWK